MSGHSKWSTIKRKKGAEDAKRGKIFTRLVREIVTAVREGGGITDPDSNPRLRIAVEKAKAANMPKDNIQRAINKGAGISETGEAYQEITYEGYGPGGVAIIVETMTDNTNRTLAEVKHAFNRSGGNLASSGAVLWQFDQKGYIEINAEGVDFDELFLQAAEAGAEDVEAEEDIIVVYTPRTELHNVVKALQDAGYEIADSKLAWIPQNEVEVSTEEALQVFKLIEKLEELDDVQNVSSNLKFTAEAMQAFEAE
ncbi:MAG: YebC/PmpR family DNA-binding transcriptional regulator [Phototrophicales bacterium]|nr:MAG: YebC/PmpR family DNA-binding transcriptional regulator [Phototrophicales bacterium]